MKARLLVVNDDPTQLHLACALLERAGYRVDAVPGAAEALASLEANPDTAGIVTDLHMPEIDGWRLCRLLRSPAYAPFNSIPILVTSATFHGEEASRLTTDLGANAFLPAPYRPASLHHAVGEMLAGRRPVTPVTALLVGAAGPAREALEAAFNAHGYVVSATAGRAGAERALAHDPPDVAILEDELPDGSATDLLASLKRPGSTCAAVVISREPRADRALQLMRSGADAHVAAPFEADFVVETCERIRRQRALLRVEELLECRTQELRASERRFRAIFRALPDLVLIYGRDGRILRANLPAEDVLGYDPLVGRTVESLVAPAHRAAFAARTDEPWIAGIRHYETVLEAADGRTLEVQVAESPFRLAGEDATLAVARDMSLQRRTERSRTLLASALEQVSEIILITDRSGHIDYANPAFERITGYGAEETAGARVDQLCRAPGEEGWDEMLATLRKGRPWRGRMRRRRRDGSTYVSDGTVSPVRGSDGEVLHYIGVERDVTQQVELERAVVQSQKMEAIGTLAGGVAHDFNNLLTGILGYAGLIRRLSPEGSEAAEMAATIEASAGRASQLTKQLLGFARRGKHRNVPLDLNETVRDVAKLLGRTLDKRIRIEVDLLEDSAPVCGDPSQLEQALLNLAVNARDAMTGCEHGVLRFETRRFVMDARYCRHHPGSQPGAYVLVSVRDNGSGIPADVLPRIFEPFFTTKPPGEGTGMGLSMVYGTVKNHGGTIRVYSEPGHGTTFRVYLPLHREAAQAAADAPHVEPVRGTGRVLVVDDEEVVRQLAADILRHLGYEPVPVGEPARAVEMFREDARAFDLVLLDMIMPGMTGEQCFRALRSIDPHAKVVLSTGFGLNDAAQKLMDEGVLGFVPKPYSAAELAEVVAKVLKGQAAVVAGK